MGRNLRIPPSVKPGIPKLGVKPKGWRVVAFKDILEVVVRPAKVKPNQRYQLINAKRNRGGIVPRASLLGRQIKTTTQFIAAANDFVISRRQIVHGACGIVPPELDGALVSNEYSTLVPKDGLLLPYLGYYAHTIHFQQTCFNSSVGVAIEKMVFNLDHWLRHRLYLPPVEYQQEVVDVLATTDRAIAGVEKLIAAKRTLKKGLAQQLLTGQRRLPGFNKPWGKHEFDQLFLGANSKKKQVQSADYRESGCFPIVDQGKKAIAGYCDDESKVYTNVPVIVFGDHTREVKYVHFPFVCGSDGTQLLRTTDLLHIEYGYQLLANHRLPSLGYSRHMSVLKEQVFRVAVDGQEQARIAAVLGAADREIVLLEKKLAALRELKKGLMQKLLSGPVKVKA